MSGRAIEKARNPRDALMRLLRYLRPFRLRLSVVVILIVISTLLSLIGPFLIGVAIDQFIATHDIAGLLRISLLMVST
jgi:ATP-binding cassette subfamily B protein